MAVEYIQEEEVANKVARLDLLAIPVVDHQHKMLGIITHDDVIDVVRERRRQEDATLEPRREIDDVRIRIQAGARDGCPGPVLRGRAAGQAAASRTDQRQHGPAEVGRHPLIQQRDGRARRTANCECRTARSDRSPGTRAGSSARDQRNPSRLTWR